MSAGSALVVGQLLLLYAKPAAELRGAVGVGWGVDEALPMRDAAAVDAGIGARSCKPLEGVVLLCQLRLLLTHAADAAAAAADDCGLHTGRGGWEMISQRGLAAACAAATALAPGVARAGAAERRRPYKDDTLPLLLPLLLTLEARASTWAGEQVREQSLNLGRRLTAFQLQQMLLTVLACNPKEQAMMQIRSYSSVQGTRI